jgi:hypothetical protein
MERKTCNDTLKYGCEDALKQLVTINGGMPHIGLLNNHGYNCKIIVYSQVPLFIWNASW